MRKAKKILALASLLCTSALCVGFGATALNNNQQMAAAETTATTTTWTDTASGKTYTFEGDIKTHNTTDIRDLGMNDLLKTAEGVTGFNGNPYQLSYKKEECMINTDNAAWVGETGGVAFQFKTDSYWYSPAAKDVGGNTYNAANDNCRINIFYGDIYVQFSLGNWATPCFLAKVYPVGSATDIGSNTKRYIDDFFAGNPTANSTTTSACYLDDFVEVKISKYDCTAISDGSTASGYWFKLSVNDTVLYDKYINRDMESMKSFGICNATAGRVGQEGITITDANWKGHTNLMTVKSLYTEATATLDTETWKDVGDMEDKALSDKYVMGFTTGDYGRFYNADDFIPNGTADSVGLEVRAKHVNAANIKAQTTTTDAIVQLTAGATYVFADYAPTYKKLRFWAYNCNDVSGHVGQTSLWCYDYNLDSEYVWRITRTAVNFTNAPSMEGKGALVNLYIGEIDPTTNQPKAGWDEKPVYSLYDPKSRVGERTERNGLCISPAKAGPNQNVAHSMAFSSNKYVGVQTTLGDTITTNKVERGGNFVLAEITAENTFHIGWSKGASQYTAEDFVANGTEITNLQESVSYKALAFTLKADKKAALRFRQRMEDGVMLPVELSLKWNIEGQDLSNLAYYFGGIEFGYKLTCSNGTSYAESVEKISDGFTKPYQYSVTQSNIGEEDYMLKFVCQGYVVINDITYYTDAPDVETDGRSVDFVADAAAADYKDASEGIYTKLIYVDGEEKYHYLGQEEYDLVAACGAVNS